MVDYKKLDLGSVVEVNLGDSKVVGVGDIACGIVTDISKTRKDRVLTRGHGTFDVQVMIGNAQEGFRIIIVDHTDVVYINNDGIDFDSLIDAHKERVMRWTAIYSGSESDALTFKEISEPDDSLTLTPDEVDKLKTMFVGQLIHVGNDGWTIKRVA